MLSPEQIQLSGGETIFGTVKTVTYKLSSAIHPLASVTVTQGVSPPHNQNAKLITRI